MDIRQEIPFKTNFESLIISNNANLRLKNLASSYKNPLIICDTTTHKFAPDGLKKYIFADGLKPTLAAAQEVAKLEADLLIAVGSGTINDVTKYGAYLSNRPYIAYATAASMNGYASGGASLIENGHKKSFIAKHAIAVIMDLQAIAAAPEIMQIAGIADSYCVNTVMADNFLAQQIRGDVYYGNLYELLKRYEDAMFDDITALCKTLIFGGIAMNIAGSSAPASQAEHMLAHYMELMQPTAPHSLHGQQIAVTMLTMAKKMEESGTQVQVQDFNEAEIISHFGNDSFVADAVQKYKNIAGKKFTVSKPNIDANKIEAKLKSIGAPTNCQQIGWDNMVYVNAQSFARYTRNRLTYLDVV